MAERAERVLFVHAHPGDETLATGATIATLVDAGAEVTVLTCTRGELGEVVPPELKYLTGAALGAHRETELAAALAVLGVGDHRILGTPQARWASRQPRRYLDSGMRGRATDAVPGASLTEAEFDEVAADIAAVIVAIEPDVVVSCAPDGHPDRARVHEATRAAAGVMRVPFYAVDRLGGRRGPVVVDAAPVLERTRAALAAHRTSVTVQGGTVAVGSGKPRPIDAVESFTRVHPVALAFGDYALGSRIVALVLAAALGAVAGAALTVAHQATVAVGPVVFPWGIVVAVLVTTTLLVGLRMVFDTRLVAASAAVGLLVVSAFFALQSGGGSVLVPGNLAGYTWTFAPVVIALVVLGWPRFDRQVHGR